MAGTILTGGETEGRFVFNGRDRYSEYINDYSQWFVGNRDIDSNFINLWERGLYGKIDTRNIPIFVKEEKLIPIEDTDPVLYSLDFVYAMFTDMKRYFFNITSKNNIKTNKFWNGKVTKSWKETFVEYSEYRRNWDLIFWRWYYSTSQNTKVKTFDQFLNTFVYYKKYVQDDPYTISGWLSSSYAPYNVSGLIIEIATEQYSDDQRKINSYYDKNTYSAFLDSARRFGFMVDQNAPWRLIADIDSMTTQFYIQRSWEYTDLQNKYAGIPLYGSDLATELDDFITKYSDYREYSETQTRIKTQDILDEYFSPCYLFNGGEHVALWENLISMYKKDKPNGCTSYPNTKGIEFYTQIRETESKNPQDLLGYVKKHEIFLDESKILSYVNSKIAGDL